MWFGDAPGTAGGVCADDASQFVSDWQGEINSPDHFAFNRGFDLLFNNRSALTQAVQLAAWSNSAGLEAGFQFSQTEVFPGYTNNEPSTVDPRVAPGPSVPRAWLHIHPPGSAEGLSGGRASGDGYWTGLYPVYALTSKSGKLWYSDRQLMKFERQVELPRLNVPSRANPGFFPKFVSPR
jgi:hypothetical protein